MATFDEPTFVTEHEWAAARRDLLDAEKAATRAADDLARRRRSLPWQLVEDDYRLAGVDGSASLNDLFDGRNQLVVYHFMFEPSWDEGCPSCSFWADHFAGAGLRFHLARRDTSFAVVSNASVDQIETYRSTMGWDLPWYSAGETSFGADFGVNAPADSDGGDWPYNVGTMTVGADSMPGLSVFARAADGRIGLTYSAFARGLEPLNVTYGILDLTAAGRDESELPHTMAWLERSRLGESVVSA